MSSWPSSRRRTAGFDDRLVRWGGMKDGWFLGTRNLGGGANVRTMIKRDLTVATTGKDRTVVIVRVLGSGPIG